MNTPAPEGYMKDAQNRLVPIDLVKEIDRERDALVREIVAAALAVNAQIAAFKKQVFGDIQAFVDLAAEKHDKSLGGIKGNVTLGSYDGEYRIIRAIDEYHTFNEQLQIAKQLIDRCITRWAEGSDQKIRLLVQDAFQVDKKGRVNTKRILGLKRLQIEDEEWQKAMTAIADSLEVAGTKEYIRIYQKDAEGEYQQISLDVAR